MGLMNCVLQDICLLLLGREQLLLFFQVAMSGLQYPTVNGDTPKVSACAYVYTFLYVSASVNALIDYQLLFGLQCHFETKRLSSVL